MMKQSMTFLFVALFTLVTFVSATPTAAQISTGWIGEEGNWDWTDGAKWDNGVPSGGGLPGTGDTVTIKKGSATFNRHQAINMNGAPTMTLEVLKADSSSQNPWTNFYDADYLTPNATPLGSAGDDSARTNFTVISHGGTNTTLIDAAEDSPKLTVQRTMYFRKEGLQTYYMPVDVGDYRNAGSRPDFYGPLTITGTEFWQEGRADTNDVVNFYNTVSAAGKTIRMEGDKGTINAHDTVTAGAITVKNAQATYNALAGNSAGGAAATINVDAGIMNFDVAQTAFPSQINVAAYGVLKGDLTGASYGVNTDLAEDAVLALTANEPVDTTPGAADAKYWLAATDPNGTYEASNELNSVYKGVAFSGALVTSNAACTFQTVAGSSENLQVLVFGSGRNKTSNMSWLSDTGVADITSLTTMTGDGGAINANYAGGRTVVTTFNFNNGVTHADNNNGSKYDNGLYNHGGGSLIPAGQTFNMSEGTFDFNKNGGVDGTIALDDKAMLKMGTRDLAASATGAINIHDGGAVQMRADNQNSLETFLPAQITASGTYYVAFEHRSNVLTIDNASNPNLATLMAGAKSIGLNYHDDRDWLIDGDGIALKDGQFLVTDGYQNKTTKILAGSSLSADAAASAIGLAAGQGQRLQIEETIGNLAGKELMINSTSLEVVTHRNHRDDATGIVTLNVAVAPDTLNVATGELETGTAQTLTNLILNGQLDTQGNNTSVSGTLSGAGDITGAGIVTVNGTVAPGNSIGALGDGSGDLTMGINSIYSMEIADKTLAPGVGYDTINVANAAFSGAWTLDLVDAGLVGSIEATDEFVILEAGGYTGTPIDDVNIIGAGFDTTNAVLIFDDENADLLLLTGVIASGLQEGDFNTDGKVEQLDLTLLLNNWGSETQPGGWNCAWDGKVDQTELTDLLTNWGVGVGPQAVPEPSCLALLAVGGLALAMIRRRR